MSSLRIGDIERERAVERLKSAYTDGRLDSLEFEDRAEQAMQARTQDELGPLLADLPIPADTIEPPAAASSGSIRSRIADGLTKALRCAVCCWLPPGRGRSSGGGTGSSK